VPTPCVTSAGIREVLGYAPQADSRLDNHAKTGARALAIRISATAYAELLSDTLVTLSTAQWEAGLEAGKWLGAAALRDARTAPMGDRGALSSETKGDGAQQSYVFVDDGVKAAVLMRERATQILKDADIYVRPAAIGGTVIALDDDDTDEEDDEA